MQAEKQLTCAQRVAGELQREIETLRGMWDVYTGNAEPTEDVTEDTFHEHGLSFDYVAPGTFDDQEEGYWRYQISWGGPSDEFRFYASPGDRGWSCYRIEYWFLDWGDGARITLTGDDLAFMREIWDFFEEVGSVQAEMDKATAE